MYTKHQIGLCELKEKIWNIMKTGKSSMIEIPNGSECLYLGVQAVNTRIPYPQMIMSWSEASMTRSIFWMINSRTYHNKPIDTMWYVQVPHAKITEDNDSGMDFIANYVATQMAVKLMGLVMDETTMMAIAYGVTNYQMALADRRLKLWALEMKCDTKTELILAYQLQSYLKAAKDRYWNIRGPHAATFCHRMMPEISNPISTKDYPDELLWIIDIILGAHYDDGLTDDTACSLIRSIVDMGKTDAPISTSDMLMWVINYLKK